PKLPRPLKTYELSLVLPESSDPPDYAPERITTLKIGGKDYSEPYDTKRLVKVKVPTGKTSVKVEYNYWPNTYTNIIRSRDVKLTFGKRTTVDLTKKLEGDNRLIKPIYVPTPDEVVEAMGKMAKITERDAVY